MSTFETHFERDKNSLRELYYEHGSIALFALGLTALVCLSYYLSRFIPADTFAHVISPILHGCLIAAAVGGAIIMHWHTDGIYARRVWQMALIAWAVMEVTMLLMEAFLGVSTPVRGVQTIGRLDFIVRDVMAIILLAYPFEVLRPKWFTWWRGVLLMLPPFLIMALDVILQEDLRALQIVYPLLIAGWLWSKIREYRAKVEENYSSLENSAMPWLKVYLCILTIAGLSYFYISFTYHPTRLFTQQWLVLALLVYNTAQIVYRRKPWLESIEEEENVEVVDEVQKQYRANLEAWMANDKPYLNPDFRLTDLMQVLPMNRTYLSKFISTEYGCTFYQFVTRYRIEEAQRLMKEQPDLFVQEVSEQCGFSSPTVFGRTFSREVGMTPGEWCKKIDNK